MERVELHKICPPLKSEHAPHIHRVIPANGQLERKFIDLLSSVSGAFPLSPERYVHCEVFLIRWGQKAPENRCQGRVWKVRKSSVHATTEISTRFLHSPRGHSWLGTHPQFTVFSSDSSRNANSVNILLTSTEIPSAALKASTRSHAGTEIHYLEPDLNGKIGENNNDNSND